MCSIKLLLHASCVLLLVCVISHGVQAAVKCGVSSVSHARIVGGEETVAHQFPWMAYIQVELDPNDTKHNMRYGHCGGSLIDEQWIVTAAHCFVSHTAGYHTNLNGAKTMVLLGAHNLTNRVQEMSSRVVAKIDKVYQHEHYNPALVGSDNDIALIKLLHPVNLEQHHNTVVPICLPVEGEAISKTECSVSGWGRTAGNETGSDVLRMVKLNLYTQAECHQHGRVIDKLKVCGGFLSHRPCKGDSGGPFQCRSSAGQWVLQGITSYGQIMCDGDKPSVFTNVEAFLPWISKIKAAHA